jgi:hypothetical protein
MSASAVRRLTPFAPHLLTRLLPQGYSPPFLTSCNQIQASGTILGYTMFKAIFEGLASASQSSTPYSSYNAPTSSGKKDEDPRKKINIVTLRGDIYKAMDLAHNWMAGGNVGDGLGYRAILVSNQPFCNLPSTTAD